MHDGAETLEARHALGELLGELSQLADGALHAGDIHVEGHKRGDIHLFFHNQVAADKDDGQAHQVHHQFRAGEEARHHFVVALLGGDILVGAVGEFVDFLIFVAKSLGDADAGDGAFNLGVDARRAALYVAGDFHHAAPTHRHKDDDHGHGDHQHERQLFLNAPEDEERAGQRHHGDEQVFRTVVRQLGDIKQIRRHAGHEQTRSILVVEAEAQLLHMRKDCRAHIRLDVNARQVSQIGDNPLGKRAQDEQTQHRKHHEDERAQSLIGNIIVKHLARHDGEGDIHQRDDERTEHVQQEHAHVRLVERGKFTQCAALGGCLFLKGRERFFVVFHGDAPV